MLSTRCSFLIDSEKVPKTIRLIGIFSSEKSVIDPLQGMCENIEVAKDAQFCTIISSSYMSDFDGQWINHFTECPTILLSSWRGLNVERHGRAIRVVSNSPSSKTQIQFDTFWTVNGELVESPTSFVRGSGKSISRHAVRDFDVDNLTFDELKTRLSNAFNLENDNSDDTDGIDYNIFRTSSYEVLYIGKYELAVMIDQTHNIVKLAIPSGSLDFTGGVCVAGMYKPDLVKARSASEFFEAWAAEADETDKQILTTLSECGEEEQVEVPVVPPRECQSYAFTSKDYIGEAKVLYGAHCRFLIDSNGPFAKCFQLTNPYPYYQACISDLGRTKNFNNREAFGQAYSEECAFSNFHVDAWRDVANLAMLDEFRDEIDQMTEVPDNAPEKPEDVEQYEEANKVVFLIEEIFEQIKLFIKKFVDSTDERIKLLDTDWDEYRIEMQAELDALLESETIDDVKSIYYSIFFRIFERFDNLKWYNFKYTSIFEAVFNKAFNVTTNKLDIDLLFTCFVDPSPFITTVEINDDVFQELEGYVRNQVVTLERPFCQVMDEVDGIARARFNMNYFDLWQRGQTNIGNIKFFNLPTNLADDVLVRFKRYVNIFSQLLMPNQNIDFCQIYSDQAANFVIDSTNQPSILNFFLLDAGDSDLIGQVLSWMIGDSWTGADFDLSDANSILSQVNTQFYADTEADVCTRVNTYTRNLMIQLNVKFEFSYDIKLARVVDDLNINPRAETVIQRVIDFIVTAMFYQDEANSCQVLAMRFGDDYEAMVQLKFTRIMAYFESFDVDNASDAEWDEILNRVLMLWLGDLQQASEWTGKQCPSDCTEPEPWPKTPKSPKTPKTPKTKSPKWKKSKSKKKKSKSKKYKTAKWKSKKKSSKKHKKTAKYKHVKTPKKTPKSPKWKSGTGKHKTHKSKSYHKSWWRGSGSGKSGSRYRRSGSNSGSGKRKGKRRGSPPRTRSPKSKGPKTASPKWRPKTPAASPKAPDYSGSRCNVVGVWCMANQAIRTAGFTTINEFEGQLYYFNSRSNFDIETTLVTFDATSNKYSFFLDSTVTTAFTQAELNVEKTTLTFTGGEVWYRSGSAECNALLPSSNVNIDDVYPAVKPRTCGAEYKYKFNWIRKALDRLNAGTKLVNGNNLNMYLKTAIRTMIINYRANPTTYQFCSGFDAEIANSFSASFSGGFYLREKFELSKVTFGMDWREFMTYMYEDTLQKKIDRTDDSLDFADFVADDFANFFLNKQNFYQRAALTLEQVGVYRPSTVKAQRLLNLQLRSMRKKFALGIPFCEVMDTTYREVDSFVEDRTDRFTASVTNFGNSIRYYIEEFILEVFKSNNNFCAAVNDLATNSWDFDMTTESASVYGYIKTGISLAKSAFADDSDSVKQFASQLFNDLQFSSFADQNIDIDFKAVIKTAFENVNMGTTNFDFIVGDDTKKLNDAFFARIATMFNSFGDITDFADSCANTPDSLTTIFADFVTETQVFPQGFCDANWSNEICALFNNVVDGYNNLKLKYDLFESPTLADIAAKVSIKVDKVTNSLPAKVGILQKGKQLAKKVVENFNEARTRLAPLQKVKAAFAEIGPKLVAFIGDVANLRTQCESANADAVAANKPAIYSFTGEAWTMLDTLVQEATDWNTNGAGRKRRSVKSRRRRSFNDLDYNDPADRHILRQHVPFFSKLKLTFLRDLVLLF